MRKPRTTLYPGALVLTCVWLALPTGAYCQSDEVQDAPQPAAPKVIVGTSPADNLKAINDEYDRQLLQLERQRLDRLARLAVRQAPVEAAATYEQLFRLAIAGNLFREAESAADQVVQKGSASPVTGALAQLVKIIAEADRGAYDQSLATLQQAIQEKGNKRPGGDASIALSPGEVVGLCEAYYQRLVHADQFETARKAFGLALGQARDPAVKDFLAGRLKRLDLVGKPAPSIEGTDVDGKRFNLADHKGKVVLVEFWASWCLPNSAELTWFQQVHDAHRAAGFEVVGINLDIVQDGGQKLESVMPNIRRFLLDHNVSWPNLINGKGNNDYAAAYGITDIPANVLVGRDGTVIHLDLVHKNLESVVAKAVGR